MNDRRYRAEGARTRVEPYPGSVPPTPQEMAEVRALLEKAELRRENAWQRYKDTTVQTVNGCSVANLTKTDPNYAILRQVFLDGYKLGETSYIQKEMGK